GAGWGNTPARGKDLREPLRSLCGHCVYRRRGSASVSRRAPDTAQTAAGREARAKMIKTRLSVNVNKIALLRNTRNIGIPSVRQAAIRSIQAGAHGITVHPRPDQRHIRPSDVYELSDLLQSHPHLEFNIEGNPFPEFMEIVRRVRPSQCTLVPDSPDAVTSDHGWDVVREAQRLAPVISELKTLEIRVRLLMDADSGQWKQAADIGADRVE